MRRIVEPTDGFEPSTCGLRNRCSTTELRWPVSLRCLRVISAKSAWGQLGNIGFNRVVEKALKTSLLPLPGQ